jgi:hypothetical protein
MLVFSPFLTKCLFVYPLLFSLFTLSQSVAVWSVLLLNESLGVTTTHQTHFKGKVNIGVNLGPRVKKGFLYLSNTILSTEQMLAAVV